MYFLAKGDALVEMKDKHGKDHNLGKFGPGSHFGEIALIYQSKRTASVISGNYSTFAKLTFEKFKELTQYIPELEAVIKKHILTYEDPVKKQLLQMFKRIELLNDNTIPQSLLAQLLYLNISKQYDKGQLIFKPGDTMNTIQIIELGVVEIYTYFEGKKFILERLYRGSVMNYRNLFLEEEPMHVYAECLNSCYIFEIEEVRLISIINQN